MVTVEQTEKVETGLDVAIKSEDGRVLAWCYSEDMAKIIVDGMNNYWRNGFGHSECSGCQKKPTIKIT